MAMVKRTYEVLVGGKSIFSGSLKACQTVFDSVCKYQFIACDHLIDTLPSEERCTAIDRIERLPVTISCCVVSNQN